MASKHDWRLDWVENKVQMSGRLMTHTHRKFLMFVNEVHSKAISEVVLDFSGCTSAFPNTMVPIIAQAAQWRAKNIKTRCVLPSDEGTRRLFLNTNWAYFLDPDSYLRSDDVSNRHLAVQQFISAQEQQDLVNRFIDVTMGALRLDRKILRGLEWSINEITDNVLNHAEAPLGGFVQLQTHQTTNRIAFCVADTGRGILRSLQEGIPNLQSDKTAIGQAVRAGVTRNRDIGQGNGLSGSLNIATNMDGSFRLASGSGDVMWKKYGEKPYEGREFPPNKYYQGTIVDVQISTISAIDLGRVIAQGTNTPVYEPSDRIELHYLSDDAKRINVQMKNETAGFGSRQAGRQIRVKCINLMFAEPECLLVVDWDGIQLISSSFADEFVGKLFVEFGPMRFMGKVRQINCVPVVQQLIDRAIMQRTSQTMSGPSGA